jgi:hypothetical protein
MADQTSSSNRTAVVVAIIGAIALISSTAISSLITSCNTSKSIYFSGNIRDETGNPVTNARIITTQDQGVPQIIYSDTDGFFRIELSKKTTNLCITANAEGFEPTTKIVDIHRTGPEEIYLRKTTSRVVPGSVPRLSPTKPVHKNILSSKTKNNPPLFEAGSVEGLAVGTISAPPHTQIIKSGGTVKHVEIQSIEEKQPSAQQPQPSSTASSR